MKENIYKIDNIHKEEDINKTRYENWKVYSHDVDAPDVWSR